MYNGEDGKLGCIGTVLAIIVALWVLSIIFKGLGGFFKGLAGLFHC